MLNPTHPLLQKNITGKLFRLTQKTKTRTDKGVNGYCDIYESYFNSLKDKPIKLLELGVGSSDAPSLKLWETFFPNAQIIGIDHVSEYEVATQGRVKVEIGNFLLEDFANNIINKYAPFDIIIDDAGHYQSEIITAFKKFWPHVADNGLYVIEDLLTAYCPCFEGGYRKLGTAIEFLKELIDSLHVMAYKKTPELDRFKPFNITVKDEPLDIFENTLYSMHFYQGMCFLFKGNKF